MNTWLKDANGNKCSIEYFGSEKAAQKALDSLINCSGCTNCFDCSHCSRCSGCFDCFNCFNCSGCSRCSRCSGCSSCFDCSGCFDCSDCTGCSGCSGKSGKRGDLADATPQPDPVRDELVKSIWMLRELLNIMRGSTGDVELFDGFKSDYFPAFDRRVHEYSHLERWTLNYVDAALSKAKEE